MHTKDDSVRAFLSHVPHIHGVTHLGLKVDLAQSAHDYAQAIMTYRVKPAQDAMLKQFRLNFEAVLCWMRLPSGV